MFYLSRFIIFRGTMLFAVATHALDTVSFAAAFVTGEAAGDLQALLTAFGF